MSNEEERNQYARQVLEQMTGANTGINKVADAVSTPSALEQAGQIAGVANAVVNVATFTWNVGSWFFPSDEQKFRKAYRALNECLTDHKNGAKDDGGIPLACGATIDRYTRIAGFESLNQIKAAYTKK